MRAFSAQTHRLAKHSYTSNKKNVFLKEMKSEKTVLGRSSWEVTSLRGKLSSYRKHLWSESGCYRKFHENNSIAMTWQHNKTKTNSGIFRISHILTYKSNLSVELLYLIKCDQVICVTPSGSFVIRLSLDLCCSEVWCIMQLQWSGT